MDKILDITKVFSKWKKNSGSIPMNACVAWETQLCVTAKKVWLPDRRTDRQTLDKVIPMSCYASQATQ